MYFFRGDIQNLVGTETMIARPFNLQSYLKSHKKCPGTKLYSKGRQTENDWRTNQCKTRCKAVTCNVKESFGIKDMSYHVTCLHITH